MERKTCIECGAGEGEPHHEECMADEHEQMLAGNSEAVAFHDPDACELCLLTREKKCECRCGRCCELLLIETTLRDGEREPRIPAGCSPIYGGIGEERILIGWLLNDGGACHFFDKETRLCTIYETRPLCCRLFDCDREPISQHLRSEDDVIVSPAP